ncbi:MAG TPA: cadherin-like beta sandwich domain-containing protein [Lachnospiraceae bacterium]|nr:cadherin-like beta sandwich domain-containing protein [Lachnospiraceae bacterium]
MKDRRGHKILVILLCIMLASQGMVPLSKMEVIQAATVTLDIPAIVTAEKLNVRKSAGRTATQLTVSGAAVSIVKDAKVVILSEKIVSGEKWYYISFVWKGTKKTGYVISDYIKLLLNTTVKAEVNSTTKVKMRKAAGSTSAYYTVSGKVVSLSDGKYIIISKEVTSAGKKYFKVKFKYGDTTHYGYIEANKVLFKLPVTQNETDNSTGDQVKPIDTGTVYNTNKLNVRVAPGTTNAIVKDANGNSVGLVAGTKVSIYSKSSIASVIWYEVTFTYGGKQLKGYVSGDYIKLDSQQTDTGSSQGGDSNSTDPTDGGNNSGTGSNTGTDSGNGSNTNPDTTGGDGTQEDVKPLTDAEFEQSLVKQGFPESYKSYLRNLHQLYPYWQFEAYHTGLEWTAAINAENKVGYNLIPNKSNLAWKSMETGAYKWATDSFIPYDGSTWVTASKEIIAYYMDPRNFLTPQGVFQFELLTYQNTYQTEKGVEKVLYNTPMYSKTYTYTDDSNTQQTITYAKTFIDAAAYSGVSPYHLATRVKQEVLVSSTALSSSVSGTVSGYEGLYNFYNIGAYHSTAPGGAILNGLKYAKSGTTNAANNLKYLIPWTSPYRSIVGGAMHIGSNYILRGQNTIYLEKFNMTPISTYSHQYMANVQAAASEASKTFSAYSGMMDVPLVFSIPVFYNMPEKACGLPADRLNPNNWLQSLLVDGYTLTPTFDPSLDQMYGLIVDPATVSININATAASRTARVIGNGTVALNPGNNVVTITVIAENGDTKTYTINVVR